MLPNSDGNGQYGITVIFQVPPVISLPGVPLCTFTRDILAFGSLAS